MQYPPQFDFQKLAVELGEANRIAERQMRWAFNPPTPNLAHMRRVRGIID
jgi:hypothetical protein